jgi:hypothetical protein
MHTTRHIDTIGDEAISTRVIVAHAEMNVQFVSDLPCEFACMSTLQVEASAPTCFSSRSAADNDHRVRTTEQIPCYHNPRSYHVVS